MRFTDRSEAGQRLAAVLDKYKGQDGIVYALPRGGVVLGVEVAAALAMPLDLIIPRKIGHPWNPEYAICAVAEEGDLVC
ncbi:MAG: phosphoribosyl transferase, partial [Pseudomonadota bacterium]|nr:phosphoribosyl transferase [Pseudomonadota bacterium]